jgi:N-acetylglucosaminyldiphosphoundecaprenol N-acetyl-beta-D-mannosaminyltransferase
MLPIAPDPWTAGSPPLVPGGEAVVPIVAPPQKKSKPPERFAVLGVRIANVLRSEAIELLDEAIALRSGRPTGVFFVNAHTLNLAAADPSYRDALNAADYVFADGTGVRWAARLQNVRIRENMVGTDFVPQMFRAMIDRGYSYYMLGGDAETAALAAEQARRMFPSWRLSGFHHGFLDDAASKAIVAEINDLRPDVLLVGMGNPLQERWILRHRDELGAAVCLGVGGLFDFWAGKVSRAPAWLRRIGHEWIWRMVEQPRDKCRRYLIGNPLFLYRVVREKFL